MKLSTPNLNRGLIGDATPIFTELSVATKHDFWWGIATGTLQAFATLLLQASKIYFS